MADGGELETEERGRSAKNRSREEKQREARERAHRLSDAVLLVCSLLDNIPLLKSETLLIVAGDYGEFPARQLFLRELLDIEC